jgi:hypothetical protein
MPETGQKYCRKIGGLARVLPGEIGDAAEYECEGDRCDNGSGENGMLGGGYLVIGQQDRLGMSYAEPGNYAVDRHIDDTVNHRPFHQFLFAGYCLHVW